MARIPLAQMAVRAGTRRKVITFRPILPTKVQADALAKVYRAMLAPWATARPRIEETYARELARVLATDSIDDLARLLVEEIGEEVQRLVLTLTPDLRNWALGVEAWHRRRWGDTVLAGAGVDIRYQIGPEAAQETIEAFMARNVALVKDVSAQAQGRISDAVLRGFQIRKPPREVGREIADSVGMARKRANRIAADQGVKLASALDAQRQREAGLEIYRYRHSGKLHPRDWHRARNGKLYERDSGREVEFVKGDKIYGSDTIEPDDQAGIPPFCGCTTQGVLVLDGEVLG